MITAHPARRWMLLLIAALHLGLLALVLARPPAPKTGQATYIDLIAVVQPRPAPAAVAAPAARPVRPARQVSLPQPRPLADAASPVIAAAPAAQEAGPAQPDTIAPDFAGGKAPLDLDKLRRQAAANDATRNKSVAEMAQEQELRRKSIETAVAAAAKAGTRKDCQTAFAGVGLLAIIPLLASTVADVGCKWK